MTEQHVLEATDTSPGAIEVAEDWLLAECARVLNPRGTGPCKSIESGPGEWSEDYLDRFVKSAPAIRTACLGGTADTATQLDVDTEWAVFVLTGWRGQREKLRRRGWNDGVGAYRAVTLLAPWLHACKVGDVGFCTVKRLTNLWSGQLDRKGVALWSIGLNIRLQIDRPIDEDALAEFLHADVRWDIPEGGDAEDPDATDTINLRMER